MSQRRLIAGFFLPLLLALGSGVAPAQAGSASASASTPADNVALTAERARLRDELDRAGAEIDALKKAGRGVGADYRLRARLADAEALARRLIEIETRLGLRAPAERPAPLPVAAPTDGPADLEAKADILADQSRRVRGEADALGRRVTEIRGRQELRRRAADLDSDPFAPLEGSKRRIASVATPTSGSQASVDSPSTGGGKVTLSVAPPASPQLAGAGTAPPVLVVGGSPGPATGAATTLSVELRDLLDPATVANIRRLESEGTKAPTGAVHALERAVAALRARADALDGQARAMRTSARAAH